VGTTAWADAIDHGFFIIFDLAMGGNYPDGECGCTAPASATTSGATMSVAYVAAYEEGGNSTPTATATATGEISGYDGLCLVNQNVVNTEGNPMVVANCDGDPGEEWSPYTDGTVRVQGGCLDVVSAGTTTGTDVDWYPCNGTAAQDWTAESNGELVNPNSGLCLTVPGGNTSSRLDIETCTDTTDQQWKLPTGTGSTGSGSTVTAANYARQWKLARVHERELRRQPDRASGGPLRLGRLGQRHRHDSVPARLAYRHPIRDHRRERDGRLADLDLQHPGDRLAGAVGQPDAVRDLHD
jgi:hypothetical protein